VKSGARGPPDAVLAVAPSVAATSEDDVVAASSPATGERVVAVGSTAAVVVPPPPVASHAASARAETDRTAKSLRTPQTVGRVPYIPSKSNLSPDTAASLYNRRPVPNTTLYFAYGSLLDPDRISQAAPGSRFLFTAHYPETKLDFVPSSSSGAVPTLTKESGHTVWGGVFEIPGDQVDSLIRAEEAEGRKPGFDLKAVDREGNKHDCLTFVAVDEPNGERRPDRDYLESMINGARYWRLPAGWVMGLEDLAEDPLFS